MSKNLKFRPFTIKDFMSRAITLIVSVGLIVYFMPRESNFAYEFDQGKPWKYGQLIASFDFPIYKTDAEISSERDSAMKLFQPYFEFDESISSKHLHQLKSDLYGGSIKGVPLQYISHLTRLLREVYQAGIVGSSDVAMFGDSSITALRVVSGNVSEVRSVSGVFSPRSAYEYIIHADTVNFRRDILRHCNINNYIEANLIYDKAKSKAAKEDLESMVSTASGMVQSGQKIIDRGDIVDSKTYSILESLKKESIKRNATSNSVKLIVLGQVVFVSVVLLLFTLYLNMFRRDYYDKSNNIYLLSSLVVVFPVVTSIMVDHNLFSVYLIPYAIVPIFVRIFMDTRTAFVAHMVSVLLSSIVLHLPLEFILVQFSAGLAAIYSLKELTMRSQLLRTAVIVTISSMLMGFAYDLMQGIDFGGIDHRWYIYLLLNGVLLLFAYPLMFVVEKAFGFTSSVTLIELSNTNNPLMRKMSKEAQGTFNHSMQVANLATEVANKIGAKAQLVRTGALYHDIGKINNPVFFTENQMGNNPHDLLTEEKSAEIIISHVSEGLKMADKYGLPKVIKAFIATHHGCGKTKFFYVSFINNHPGEYVNEEAFTYPGPNPSTREQAILMMADSVEAASRSLKNYTEESIRELVCRIIDGQMAEGFFRDCPITFRDVTSAKEVFIENLKTIYHTRISYPELNSQQSKDEEPPRTKTALFGGAHRRRH